MKKLFSTKYTPATFNIAIFVLRIFAGALLLTHGYDKLIHINDNHDKFASIFGLSQNVSFYMSVFAEFFCSLLIILGLFTRLAAFTLVINMSVAVIKGHNWDIFGKGEHAALFLAAFIVILLLGAGRFSIDGMISK